MGYENCGRRPEPTALTLLKGNPGRKNLNVNEVCPPAGEINKPAGLSEPAGAVWDELAPICLAMGTLTTADVRAFASLCEMQARFQESATGDGRAVLRLANGLRPYYEYFGMTPSSRARLAVPKRAEAPESKWAGALK